MPQLRYSDQLIGRNGHGPDSHSIDEPSLLTRPSTNLINVHWGYFIDAVQSGWVENGVQQFGPVFGNDTVPRHETFNIDVGAGDYLTDMWGHAGDICDMIRFGTKDGKLSRAGAWYGGEGNGGGGDADFHFEANPNEEIIGFYGYYGHDDQEDRVLIKALGAVFRTRG